MDIYRTPDFGNMDYGNTDREEMTMQYGQEFEYSTPNADNLIAMLEEEHKQISQTLSNDLEQTIILAIATIDTAKLLELLEKEAVKLDALRCFLLYALVHKCNYKSKTLRDEFLELYKTLSGAEAVRFGKLVKHFYT